MRSSFASLKGAPLLKAPNYRERAHRRRVVALAAMLGLAMSSALIGALAARTDPAARTGPFSYFPSE